MESDLWSFHWLACKKYWIFLPAYHLSKTFLWFMNKIWAQCDSPALWQNHLTRHVETVFCVNSSWCSCIFEAPDISVWVEAIAWHLWKHQPTPFMSGKLDAATQWGLNKHVPPLVEDSLKHNSMDKIHWSLIITIILLLFITTHLINRITYFV